MSVLLDRGGVLGWIADRLARKPRTAGAAPRRRRIVGEPVDAGVASLTASLKQDIHGMVPIRFWSKVDRGSSSDCWTWQGATQSHGYGCISIGGRRFLAHRVAYELTYGPIPPDLTVDHLCRNRRCVNPGHLELVTATENIYRGFAPSAVNRRRRSCVHGHPLAGSNLIVRPNGRRRCRACNNAHPCGKPLLLDVVGRAA